MLTRPLAKGLRELLVPTVVEDEVTRVRCQDILPCYPL